MAQKRSTTRKTTPAKSSRTTTARKTSPKTTARRTASAKTTSVTEPRERTATTPNNTRRYVWIIIGVLVVIALLYLAKGLFIAAMVNGQPISRFTVINHLEKQGGKQTLDSLVTQKLIEQEAAKRHVSVTQSEIDNQIKTIEKNIQSQGVTLDQALAQQGMTRQDLTDQVKLQLLVSKMVGTPKVTDKQITDYINQNKSQYPNGADAATKNQVKQQLAQQQQQQDEQTFVQKLRSNAHISYFDYQ